MLFHLLTKFRYTYLLENNAMVEGETQKNNLLVTGKFSKCNVCFQSIAADARYLLWTRYLQNLWSESLVIFYVCHYPFDHEIKSFSSYFSDFHKMTAIFIPRTRSMGGGYCHHHVWPSGWLIRDRRCRYSGPEADKNGSLNISQGSDWVWMRSVTPVSSGSFIYLDTPVKYAIYANCVNEQVWAV